MVASNSQEKQNLRSKLLFWHLYSKQIQRSPFCTALKETPWAGSIELIPWPKNRRCESNAMSKMLDWLGSHLRDQSKAFWLTSGAMVANSRKPQPRLKKTFGHQLETNPQRQVQNACANSWLSEATESTASKWLLYSWLQITWETATGLELSRFQKDKTVSCTWSAPPPCLNKGKIWETKSGQESESAWYFHILLITA